MIIRIVRMHFTQAGVDEFLEIFNANKKAIRAFAGCIHLELLRDAEDENTFATLSHWVDEASLEAYRKSELFAGVWGRVKTLFAERSQAFSLVKYIEVA
ncbi:MAG: antibiotic biosynthesis monooxygenase [Flammeovirgaceae bacterium]|nr:MAG: antibiotic biosynthesis monooxygenase [Flammeovirgaceae bacterium]